MTPDTATSSRPEGCKCSFRQFMVGDGCQYCNPDLNAMYAESHEYAALGYRNTTPTPDAPEPMEDDE